MTAARSSSVISSRRLRRPRSGRQLTAAVTAQKPCRERVARVEEVLGGAGDPGAAGDGRHDRRQPADLVSSTSRPMNRVPMNDSLTKSVSSGSSPRACSWAIRARGAGAARRAVEPAGVDRHRVPGVPRRPSRARRAARGGSRAIAGSTGCTGAVAASLIASMIASPASSMSLLARPGRTGSPSCVERRRSRRSCRRTPGRSATVAEPGHVDRRGPVATRTTARCGS